MEIVQSYYKQTIKKIIKSVKPKKIYIREHYKSDAVCLTVGDNITELKRLSSNPRIITCKPSCFQAATTSQEILYLGETTRIISFPSTTSTLEIVHNARLEELQFLHNYFRHIKNCVYEVCIS